jgi:ataxin-3
MVLTQAEQEGYSVFCVRKANQGRRQGEDTEEGVGWGDGGVGVLPECEADRIAGVLGEPVGRTGSQAATNVAGGSSELLSPLRER